MARVLDTYIYEKVDPSSISEQCSQTSLKAIKIFTRMMIKSKYILHIIRITSKPPGSHTYFAFDLNLRQTSSLLQEFKVSIKHTSSLKRFFFFASFFLTKIPVVCHETGCSLINQISKFVNIVKWHFFL